MYLFKPLHPLKILSKHPACCQCFLRLASLQAPRALIPGDALVIVLIVLLIMAIDTGVGTMGTITLTAANLEATMAAGNLDRNQSLLLLSGS